jgi:hypothetical protein
MRLNPENYLLFQTNALPGRQIAEKRQRTVGLLAEPFASRHERFGGG